MDKYEYRVKTEQMMEFFEGKQYKKAMEIADTIDWRRVKNVSMLNTVSEIYEQMGEFQKSRDILFMAFEKATGSRKIVYRLGTLALKIEDFGEATDCYEEFVKLAPKDPNQYILKYKIQKAKKAPITEQIQTLEEFKKAEYIEKWAYELAKLYHEAGMTSKCVEECDDIILWFSEGKYVHRAMELKMKYKPLTPLQKEAYEKKVGEGKGLKLSEDEDREVVEKRSAMAEVLRAAGATKEEQEIEELPVPEEATEETPVEDEAMTEEPSVTPLAEEKTMEDRDMELRKHGQLQIDEMLKQWEAKQKENAHAIEEQRKKDEERLKIEREEAEKRKEQELRLAEEKAAQVAQEAKRREEEEKAKALEEERRREEEEKRALELAKEEEEKRQQRVTAELKELLEDIGVAEKEEELEEQLELPQEIEEEFEEPLEEALEEEEFEESFEEVLEEEEFEESLEEVLEEEEEFEEDDFLDSEESEEEISDFLDDDEDEEEAVLEEDFEEEDLVPEVEEPLEIEEPSEEEIQDRIRKSKGGVPFDTGFVVTGRYDLSATSEIGLKAGLTEEQKKLFSYFVPVRGMSEQIVEVLDNDRRAQREGTSKTGNLFVIGKKGSGKTVLAVDIVKAIQKQRNLKQGKVAIVTGESLNKKELTGIIQKLRGGAIIVENAGKLNARTVKELNYLMERKTGELLFVLEDQRKPMERLLTAYPEFKKKFTSKLELPVFINDELVTFGQTYAKENGYKLDEMGILALYSRIDVLQREDHAVTVAEVKEIMDEAIEHSQKANVKHLARRVFGKSQGESSRIILKEEDFKI